MGWVVLEFCFKRGRYLFSSFAIASLLLIGGPSFAQDTGTKSASKTESCETRVRGVASKVETIADGVYVRVGAHSLMTRENLGAISNASFVVGTKAVAVIDSGGSYCDGVRLKNAILEKTKLPIRYVINTHVHPDHVMGNAAFVGPDVTFVGHGKLPNSMASRGQFYIDRFTELVGEEALFGTKVVPPSVTVDTEKTLDLGGRKLTVTAQGTAHTDNDLTVFDEKTETLWTGDLVFQVHTPVIDGKILGWMRVLDKITKIKAARAVPGHGPASVPWPAGAEPQIAYFKRLIGDIRLSIENGEFMQDAQKTAGMSEKDKWELFDEFNARNVAGAFAELEWE